MNAGQQRALVDAVVKLLLADHRRLQDLQSLPDDTVAATTTPSSKVHEPPAPGAAA
jgi:hypothetical protein